MEETFDLEQFKKNFAQRQIELAERRAQLNNTRDELLRVEKEYQRLARLKNQEQAAISMEAQELRDLEKELARRERLAAAEKKRAELLDKYNEQAAELDKLTATATWREFAFEHQIEGGKRLAIANRGLLGDKRGLGKTLTSLIYLDMAQAKKVLVIAPNDVVPQFEEEIQHWAAHRRIMSFNGMAKGQRDIMYPILQQLDSFIITLNYEAWRKDKTIVDDLIRAGIDTVILDEAHRAKSSTKITARGIFQLAFYPNVCPNGHRPEIVPWMQNGKLVDIDPHELAYCDECGAIMEKSVKNILSMTGTPILNKPQELFTMLHLVDPMIFPSERAFLRDYCMQVAPNRWKFKYGMEERLAAKMSEFFVQRTREDAGITLPPPHKTIHYIDPDPIKYPAQWEAYRNLQNAAAIVFEDGRDVSMLYILEVILRERQMMTWPAGVVLKVPVNPDDPMSEKEEIRFDVHESQKLDAVEEFVGELLEEGERVVVFSKFKAPLYELHRRFDNKYSVTTATGDDPKWHRDQVRQDFDIKTAGPDPRWRALFGTYDAFATGVNLNDANYLVLIDDEWNEGMEDQATGRIDRLNSTEQANVDIFRVRHSIDMFMEKLLEEKSKITQGFESYVSASDMLKRLRGHDE